MEFSKR